MPLLAGDKLGPYEIIGTIGAGGMGEVYRAHDTRLRRDVAIKVSAERFSERFETEARAIASLNHPNVCTLHDVGPNYLVMELVEGQTLAERITQGAIALDEALAIAKQIADALEAAHERGITHRDLKPGNIKIKPDGVVKVLDFGLAKMGGPPTTHSDNSPTLTVGPTQEGVILGTAAYMAPEQARGKEVDRRADIWSFGVVLYEMLTGQRLFQGDDASETLASVIKDEPKWERVPPRVQRVVRTCLKKDPKQRLQAIGDWPLLLEEHAPPATARHAKVPWITAGVLGLALAGASWVAWRATRPVDNPLTRLSVDLGPDAMTGLNLTTAISPDGRRLVFPERGPNGKQQLATRLLDQSEATLLPGTENGRDQFFSPDSQWIGFFADSMLKKISVQGGAPVILCDAPNDYGASWGEDETIVAALSLISPLSRVPDAGGRPQPFTRLGKGEVTHRWPQVLPGGRGVLFTSASVGVGMENANIEAMPRKGGIAKTLITGGYFGRYVPINGTRGYLVYLHQGVLSAVGLDPVRLEVEGTPVALPEEVAASAMQGGGQFDFSAAPSGHGTLVYLEGTGAAQTWPVMWLDSSGKMQPLLATPGTYAFPRFSPDGHRLALIMSTSSGTDIYVYELGRETMTRLTFGGHAQLPVWTPDGRHIVFRSSSDSGIWWIRSDGSGEPRQILAAQSSATPYSFSPDGHRLAGHESHPETGYDIWTATLDTSDPDHPKAGEPEAFLATRADEIAPMFSPDGRWIAYRSNESGKS